MKKVKNMHAQSFDESDNEMEICNLVSIATVKERGPQTLMKHEDRSPCPIFNHKSLVTLHLTWFLVLPMKLQPHMLLTLHFLHPNLHLMHLIW